MYRPSNYFAFPIGPSLMPMFHKSLGCGVEWIEKTFVGWKGRCHSKGGKVNLIKSTWAICWCLSSLCLIQLKKKIVWDIDKEFSKGSVGKITCSVARHCVNPFRTDPLMAVDRGKMSLLRQFLGKWKLSSFGRASWFKIVLLPKMPGSWTQASKIMRTLKGVR